MTLEPVQTGLAPWRGPHSLNAQQHAAFDQIAAALRSEGFPIDPDSVRIEGPLKELGLYSIKIHLAQDIDSEVKLWVVPTHTDEAAG